MLNLAHNEAVAGTTDIDTSSNLMVNDLQRTLARMSDEHPVLSDLVAVHKLAVAAHNAALTVEEECRRTYRAANSREFVVPLSFGEGRSLYFGDDLDDSFDDCRSRIIQAYDGQVKKLSGLERISPHLATQARAKLKSKQASDVKFAKKLVANEEARRVECGLTEATRNSETAGDAERSMLSAICAFRCSTVEQCREKAQYLLSVTGWMGLETEDVDALLRSFVSEPG